MARTVKGTIRHIQLEQGQEFGLPGTALGTSIEYGIRLRLDHEYREHDGIEAFYGFFGNEEKRARLLSIPLEEGDHVQLSLNDLDILMDIEPLNE